LHQILGVVQRPGHPVAVRDQLTAIRLGMYREVPATHRRNFSVFREKAHET